MMSIIKELQRKKEVIAAYQFGSHQTSKQTPLSDIDICLFIKEMDNQTILDLSSYGSEKIDISLFDNLPIYIKPEVFRGKPFAPLGSFSGGLFASYNECSISNFSSF